jgi:hypothetical protein
MRFWLHYLEMILAMVAGMLLLGPLADLLFGDLRPDLDALVMATNMSIGMTIWMLIRRHSWREILEMDAVMYLAFAVLLMPYWTGLLDEHGLMIGGHVIMLPAMLLVMLVHQRRSRLALPKS